MRLSTPTLSLNFIEETGGRCICPFKVELGVVKGKQAAVVVEVLFLCDLFSPEIFSPFRQSWSRGLKTLLLLL